MKESAVKKAVKAYLEKIGAYYFMPVQMGLGATTLDFLVCYEGKFYGIETKRPGVMKVTSRQNEVMTQIMKSGGDVCIENSTELWATRNMLARVIAPSEKAYKIEWPSNPPLSGNLVKNPDFECQRVWEDIDKAPLRGWIDIVRGQYGTVGDVE